MKFTKEEKEVINIVNSDFEMNRYHMDASSKTVEKLLKGGSIKIPANIREYLMLHIKLGIFIEAVEDDGYIIEYMSPYDENGEAHGDDPFYTPDDIHDMRDIAEKLSDKVFSKIENFMINNTLSNNNQAGNC